MNSRHPPGLYVLFLTEMWERFSYYGMRALLILFMVGPASKGGLGFNDKMAAAIYGLYTAGVYLAALPGGWIADRLLGAQRAVWFGGIIIAAGHFTLAIPRLETFFLGLVFIVLGTGLLKPNISVLVGRLYPEGGARRDAGFTIFYMGINLGALLGPLVCSGLGERVNWHYGFVAAGVGMVIGLAQFRFTRQQPGVGDRSEREIAGGRPGDITWRRDWGLVISALIALFSIVALAMARVIVIHPIWLARSAAFVIAGLAVIYFAWVLVMGRLNATEMRRVIVIAVLFLASALFWAGYEQAGSSLNLFADRHTTRSIATLNLTLPTGWFQSVPALFVIIFAPVAAAGWTSLARRGVVPSLAVKFGCGLLLLAAGFLVVAFASKRALTSGPVMPGWLIATYFFHVWGELLISPVGLSSVTKLAPSRIVGQMMGIWFLATSLGNLLAGLFAGEVSGDNAAAMPTRFLQVVMFSSAIGLLLLLCAKPIRRLAAGAE